MKHEPLVSILINSYNYDQHLREAIDSALAQTYPRTEVIVVDDGSTDDSPEIIEGYGESILAVLKENGGQASAFNAGFANCRGDVICFLDSDDLFHEDKVEETVRFLHSHRAEAKDVLLYHDLEVVDKYGASLGTTQLSKRNFKTDLLPNLYQYAREHGYIPCATSPTSGLALTRSLAERIFPIPEAGIKSSADDFVIKAASLLGEVYEAKVVLSKYRVHGENHWYGNQKPHSETFIKLDVCCVD
jgi:glycosyltransferase involved in cell wall biosynthesis